MKAETLPGGVGVWRSVSAPDGDQGSGLCERHDAGPPMRNLPISVAMTPPHPGDFVRTEVIEELGLSVAESARILGVREASLSATLTGAEAISPEMALRIEKAFGLDLDLLLRMQAWYDACRIRALADEITVERYHPASTRPAAKDRRRTGNGVEIGDSG